VFQAYVRAVLVPSLRPGDIVVMDNLGPRKNEQAVALIFQDGTTVRFLPTYSPDLNPIEMMWSKVKAVKALLRAAEARTADQLQHAIARALKRGTPHDAARWFAACGYSIIENDLGRVSNPPFGLGSGGKSQHLF
jgi:hypothetical protein